MLTSPRTAVMGRFLDDRRNSCCHSEAGQRKVRENVGPHPIKFRRTENTTNEERTITADERSETHAVPLFGSGASLLDDLFFWLSRRKCPLFTFPSSQQKALVGNGRLGYLVHILRNPMSITSTEIGILCWNFCFTHISAYPWKRYFARKIWGESGSLVISHRTSCATKKEPAYEKKTQSPTTSRISQAGLEMTKRESGDSITLDNCDSQPLALSQHLETGPFLIWIDHSVHDGYPRDSPLSDPVINYNDESVVNNVIHGSGKPCPSDCFTHAMIGDVRLPRRVLKAETIVVSCRLENFERTSWSKQHTHRFGGSHDELATTADFDKFAESFENNCPEVCDARSLWMIDCRKLTVRIATRSWRCNEIYFGIQGLPRGVQSSIRGHVTIPLSQERPDHDLRERTLQFCCERRLVVKYVDSLRQILTLRLTDASVRTRFLERRMRREVSGMQKAVFKHLSNTPRLRSCRSDQFGDRAMEATMTGKPRPKS